MDLALVGEVAADGVVECLEVIGAGGGHPGRTLLNKPLPELSERKGKLVDILFLYSCSLFFISFLSYKLCNAIPPVLICNTFLSKDHTDLFLIPVY